MLLLYLLSVDSRRAVANLVFVRSGVTFRVVLVVR